MSNFQIGDRVELNQKGKEQGFWLHPQHNKATVVKLHGDGTVDILPDGHNATYLFSVHFLQKEILTDRDWLAMAHCFSLEPGINITRYIPDGTNDVEWLIVDDSHLIVISRSNQIPYATKEEAYADYLKWKKQRDEDNQ